MTYYLSRTSESRLQGVHPDLVAVCYRALQISPIDFGIPQYGGKRTTEEQAYLFEDGKSMADGVHDLSKHQPNEEGYSEALDVYAYVDGHASWDKFHLTQVAAAFLQAASELGVRLQWGGHWKNFHDMPHFQLLKE